MTTSEKEINCNLFEQLTLIERIERQVEKGGLQAVKEEIEFQKKEIHRKLCQKPLLTSE